MRSFWFFCLFFPWMACNTPAKPNKVNNNQGCPIGMAFCDGECVVIWLDDNHCGGCNQKCPEFYQCNGQGVCERQCPPGLVACGDSCVILATDPAHCGECDRACGPGILCRMGSCELEVCTETVAEADPVILPADIIIVVDNSGSMWDEAQAVQNSMTDFVGAITASGVDAHVIMISADSTADIGICVPPPVGSGLCPADENLPRYRHVIQTVGSTNALDLILTNYPLYWENLRPDAVRHILVITDDNSSMNAAHFTTSLLDLDPSFEGFIFSGIISPYSIRALDCILCELSSSCHTADCDSCCGKDSYLNLLCVPLPAKDGTVYRELIAATGGVEGNLCIQEFMPAFQMIATVVVGGSRVACVYDIPDPPEGEVIDTTRVNVEYQPSPFDDPQDIYHVPGGASACNDEGGWYYDNQNPPQQIHLCPATCAQVTSTIDAIVKVKFGCTTIIR